MPLASNNSSVVSYSAPGTPRAFNSGPIARTMTLLVAPVMMNPSITLSPVWTEPRVLKFASLEVLVVSRLAYLSRRLLRFQFRSLDGAMQRLLQSLKHLAHPAATKFPAFLVTAGAHFR